MTVVLIGQETSATTVLTVSALNSQHVAAGPPHDRGSLVATAPRVDILARRRDDGPPTPIVVTEEAHSGLRS